MGVDIDLSSPRGEVFPWLESRLDQAPGVRRLRVGERSVLFCERRQQLFELNATADAIWGSLAAGQAPSRVVAEVHALGASPGEALAFVMALFMGKAAPRGALVLYGVGVVPISLRAFVPELALDLGLVSLAAAIVCLSGALWTHAKDERGTGPAA